MRVTLRSVNLNIQKNISKRYGDLAKLQEQLSTGKRLLRPSDDPIDVTNDLKMRTKQVQMKQYKRNIEDGLAYMGVSSTALTSMNDLLHRMRELAVQASNDTLIDTEREFIQQEVNQLYRQVISVTNTKLKGDYIFNGTQTKIPPFVIESSGTESSDYASVNMAHYNADSLAAGSTVQLFSGLDNTPVRNIFPGSFKLEVQGTEYEEGVDYTVNYETGELTLQNTDLLEDVSPGTPNYAHGEFAISFDYLTRGKDVYGNTVSSRGEVHREIEEGTSMAINISADDVLRDEKSGLEMMGTLVRYNEALHTNDQQGIQNALDEISSMFDSILNSQSEIGARVNRFEMTLSRNEEQYIEISTLQSSLEDADMADVISRYTLTENVYNAALQTAARVIQPSLANFL
ncbi:MAG: flagellar hook-associated protein FlgL [Chitinispirillaceae bacterium]